jgi:hypothetical protein
MQKLILSLSIALITSFSMEAHALYRCKNTYSQIPCAADATAAKIHKDINATPASESRGRDLCVSAIPQKIELEDAEGVKAEVLGASESAVITYANQPMVAKRYLMTVNAKNSSGVYTGKRPYFCFLSEDENRVLQISRVK